jgi:glycosyltransferase involved in cell wall biosynthesis
MIKSETTTLTVFHVMRTYGNHGGEKQLAQMFSQPAPDIEEHFAFLYPDRLCEQLFAKAQLYMHRLWPFECRPRYSPKYELLMLLPLLPWMQLRLLWLLLKHRPRTCIVHGFQAALVAWPSAVLFRNRIGFAYVHRITKSAAGRHPLFKIIYMPYRKLLGVSLAVKESLSGLAEDFKLAALENGVDIERIRHGMMGNAPRSVPTLITVGRLLPHKGQHMIIDAYQECRKEFPDLELWIVGEGASRDALEEQAKRSGGNIMFLGQREDIPQLLATSTIFCNASEWEGMSNAVLEAMAAGLPSVVVDAPGVSECHVDGVTGLIVQRNMPGLLVEKLKTLLRDDMLRQRLGQAALAHAMAKYSIQANRKNYIKLYRELSGTLPCAV